MGNHTEVNRAYKHFATQRKAVDDTFVNFGSLYADKSDLIEMLRKHPHWDKSLSSIIIDDIPTPTKALQNVVKKIRQHNLSAEADAMLSKIANGEIGRYTPEGQKTTRVLCKLINTSTTHTSEWSYFCELINYKSLKLVISVNPWAFMGMSIGDTWRTTHPAYKLLNYFNHEDSFVVFGVEKDTPNDEIFTAPKKFVQLCYFNGRILEQHSVVPKNDVVNDICSNAIENILFKNGCKTVTNNNTVEPFVGSCKITFKEEI